MQTARDKMLGIGVSMSIASHLNSSASYIKKRYGAELHLSLWLVLLVSGHFQEGWFRPHQILAGHKYVSLE
jgi:hypothetical protein